MRSAYGHGNIYTVCDRSPDNSMETKDWLSLIAVLATLVVAAINLVYNLANTRRTAYVNTVTSSRMKWIDSLRDKVSRFIGLTYH